MYVCPWLLLGSGPTGSVAILLKRRGTMRQRKCGFGATFHHIPTGIGHPYLLHLPPVLRPPSHSLRDDGLTPVAPPRVSRSGHFPIGPPLLRRPPSFGFPQFLPLSNHSPYPYLPFATINKYLQEKTNIYKWFTRSQLVLDHMTTMDQIIIRHWSTTSQSNASF